MATVRVVVDFILCASSIGTICQISDSRILRPGIIAISSPLSTTFDAIDYVTATTVVKVVLTMAVFVFVVHKSSLLVDHQRIQPM